MRSPEADSSEGSLVVDEDLEAETTGEPASEPVGDEELVAAVTALVFASSDPLSEKKIASLCAGVGVARVRAALETLKARLSASGLPLELRSIAGGWRILTAPEQSPVVERLFEARKAERISPAALETLAIVAYRQPVTKAEIEAIRGVQAGPILRSLVDRDLIKVSGRADVPGHPLQYATTKAFLDRFGLSGLGDLPRDSELTR
jgi:segregation and condensation protein B